MRSLKESILGSNNSSVFDVITDLIKKGHSKEDCDKLQELWSAAGLDVKDCRWTYDDNLMISYNWEEFVLITDSDRCSKSIEITNADILCFTSPKDIKMIKSKVNDLIKKLKTTNRFVLEKPSSQSHYIGRFL